MTDELTRSAGRFLERLDIAMEDCTEEEVRIITDTALALKESLRRRRGA